MTMDEMFAILNFYGNDYNQNVDRKVVTNTTHQMEVEQLHLTMTTIINFETYAIPISLHFWISFILPSCIPISVEVHSSEITQTFLDKCMSLVDNA